MALPNMRTSRNAQALDKLQAEWFWCDRWATSSARLLPLGPRGLYREMLTAAWTRGARLPNNHAAVRCAVGATEAEWAEYWPQIESYWRVDGAHLVNDTQLDIYAEALARAIKASTRGATAANARWKKRSTSNAQASAHAVPVECPPSPSQAVLHQDSTAPLTRRSSQGYEDHEEPQPQPERTAPPASMWKRAIAIAHLCYDRHPGDDGDRVEEFKTLCAKQGIPYGERGGEGARPLYVRALEYVEGVRARRKPVKAQQTRVA